MDENKVNRKRCMQVKFRLSPEELAVLDFDIQQSGMSRNDYLIKTLINRMGLSAIVCERKYCGSNVDIAFKIRNQRIGHASCLLFEETNTIQISSFYVLKPFQDMGIEEKLLHEIHEYAALNQAARIVAYPGPEPYCPTEWKPMDIQTAWYEAQGFQISHLINGVIPSMEKQLIQPASA